MSNLVPCKLCGQLVSTKAKAVTCWQCVSDIVEWPEHTTRKKSQGFARGWKFMKVFVHEDGRVFHKGEEQPELKGTLPPTQIQTKPKKSKAERKRDRQAALAELGQLKKDLKKATRKTEQKKLLKRISKVQKLAK